jgi:hypothetical protein
MNGYAGCSGEVELRDLPPDGHCKPFSLVALGTPVGTVLTLQTLSFAGLTLCFVVVVESTLYEFRIFRAQWKEGGNTGLAVQADCVRDTFGAMRKVTGPAGSTDQK